MSARHFYVNQYGSSFQGACHIIQLFFFFSFFFSNKNYCLEFVPYKGKRGEKRKKKSYPDRKAFLRVHAEFGANLEAIWETVWMADETHRIYVCSVLYIYRNEIPNFLALGNIRRSIYLPYECWMKYFTEFLLIFYLENIYFLSTLEIWKIVHWEMWIIFIFLKVSFESSKFSSWKFSSPFDFHFDFHFWLSIFLSL